MARWLLNDCMILVPHGPPLSDEKALPFNGLEKSIGRGLAELSLMFSYFIFFVVGIAGMLIEISWIDEGDMMHDKFC
jgi:hypothetical protein